MNLKKLKTLVFCLAIWGLPMQAQSFIGLNNWKIKTGDNEAWANVETSDADWKSIAVGIPWENCGLEGYDGFAWLRKTVVIPSSIKKEVEKDGGLVLQLATIDDADVTYFNGQIIGKTGSFPPKFEGKYDVNREYFITKNLINWDKPNVIAVRIYDFSGGGGIIGDNVSLKLKGIDDYIKLTPAFEQHDHIIKNATEVKVPVTITNTTTKTIKGKLTITITSDFFKPVSIQTIEASVKGNAKQIQNITFKGLNAGIYIVNATFENNETFAKTSFNFGIDPEKLVVKPDTQPDFTNYWMRAKHELAAVEPQYKLTKVDSFATATKDCYLIEMRSLGNVLIRGWYLVPKKEGKYPTILQVQGYSTNQMPSWAINDDGFINLVLNVRGHGNSKDNINPGFGPTPTYLQFQLADKEQYIYRGAYMDCVRAVDFLYTRREVDTAKIVVEGGSQGGALSFATAALDNKRICLCVPHVPFLSDFREYFQIAPWPGGEFAEWVAKHPEIGWENVYRTLSYIDIKNLAPWIKAPVFMGVGLVDITCPPRINFAAYNNLTVPKEYIIYPYSGHGIDAEYHKLKIEWIRKKLNMN